MSFAEMDVQVNINGSNCTNVIKNCQGENTLEKKILCYENKVMEHLTEVDEFSKSWGFNVKELYILATSFFKEKEGKAFHLSYRDKLSLVAFTQQVTHGKFDPSKSPPIGYLDVIGRDRRQAWAALCNMSTQDAKVGFINLLDQLCSLFRPFVQAHKCDLEEKERRRIAEEEERRREEEKMEQLRLEEEAKLQEEEERQRQLQQKQLVQEALNRQTFHQFKAYAEQQCPGNPDQQAVLIRQLQEQHYQQYMNQVLQQQLSKTKNSMSNCDPVPPVTIENSQNGEEGTVQPSSGESTEEEIDSPIAAASMWTRKDIQEFKNAIRKEGGDGIIKVGHGETVTVRVPTHDDGSCLFWEFATDSFDIGFGIYFEWTKTPDTQVSVHISESEDEDDEDEDMGQSTGDIEKGVAVSDKLPLSVIIPVYRRDCHEEVYAGSHMYPGQGVYLLKFDNSYSLWRSKTLFYRVYYTR